MHLECPLASGLVYNRECSNETFSLISLDERLAQHLPVELRKGWGWEDG